MKTCFRCGAVKSLSNFTPHRTSPQGRYSYCKSCAAELTRVYYRQHRKERVAYTADWQRKNRKRTLEIHRAASKKYYANNKSKHRKLCKRWKKRNQKSYRSNESRREKLQRPKRRKYERQWYKTNAQKIRHQKYMALARRKGAPGQCTSEQWQQRLAFYGWRCFYCGATKRLERDHRIPVSRGGSNWPANLVPACKSCNSSKKDRVVPVKSHSKS